MRTAKSATKHGIAETDGIYAASYPLWIEPLDDAGVARNYVASLREGI
jgi:putative uncharacterized protein (fragment)